jgi:hypothetical protein
MNNAYMFHRLLKFRRFESIIAVPLKGFDNENRDVGGVTKVLAARKIWRHREYPRHELGMTYVGVVEREISKLNTYLSESIRDLMEYLSNAVQNLRRHQRQ